MTGFFTSTATAGAIVGTGGLATYLGLNNGNWGNYDKLLFRFSWHKSKNLPISKEFKKVYYHIFSINDLD